MWVHTRLCKLQKGCTRLAAASDKAYQLLAHGRWFSPGTSASSTTKTGRHDVVEILLKVALNTKNQSIQLVTLLQIMLNYLIFYTWSPVVVFCLYLEPCYVMSITMMTVFVRLLHQYFVFFLDKLHLRNAILFRTTNILRCRVIKSNKKYFSILG